MHKSQASFNSVDGDDETELVWVPHPTEAFVACLETGPGNYVDYATRRAVACPAGARVGPTVTPRQLNEDYPDMVKMHDVSEAAILHNLRQRFMRDEIYTNIGDILVSLNPYKWLTHLFTEDSWKAFSQLAEGDEVPPHIFGIASVSYRSLLGNKNQSILISGESGAGKTEATKKCLAYFASVAGANSGGMEDKILKANPILEAFGNAKTVRNNNSSRFGKWMVVYFDRLKFEICGSNIVNYLLEQSRIVGQNPGERNYHVFYQLIACGDQPDHPLARWPLGSPDDYAYLRGGGTHDVDGIDDVKEFQELSEAFVAMQFKPEETDSLLRVAVGVLQLGNVQFTASKGDGSGCKAVLGGVSGRALAGAAGALGLEASKLAECLTVKVLIAGRNRTSVPLDDTKARVVRDSLAKWLFNRAFNWLVARISKSMVPSLPASKMCYTGLLDIFGFEIFEHNTFEQLCINFCNERLQANFNVNVFQKEQELYRKEGITAKKLEWVSNQHVIDLIEKKPKGIFPLLDNQWKMGARGSDKTFLSNCEKYLVDKKAFVGFGPKNPKIKRGEFAVVHYAGKVFYQSAGFLEKNSDAMTVNLEEMVTAAQLPFVADLHNWSAASAGGGNRAGGHAKKKSVSGQFCTQLTQLMDTIAETNPSYVRCIKPNSVKRPAVLEAKLTLEQLTYAGVFQAVEIRQTGYPFRLAHKDFCFRFRCLYINQIGAASLAPAGASAAAFAKECRAALPVLKAAFPGAPPERKGGNPFEFEMEVGLTRVFYRSPTHRRIERARRIELGKSATKLERVYRGMSARKLVGRIRAVVQEITVALAAGVSARPAVLQACEEALQHATELGDRAVLIKTVPACRVRAGLLRKQATCREHLLPFLAAGADPLRDEKKIAAAVERGDKLGMGSVADDDVFPQCQQLLKSVPQRRSAKQKIATGAQTFDSVLLDEAAALGAPWANTHVPFFTAAELAAAEQARATIAEEVARMAALVNAVNTSRARLGPNPGRIGNIVLDDVDAAELQSQLVAFTATPVTATGRHTLAVVTLTVRLRALLAEVRDGGGATAPGGEARWEAVERLIQDEVDSGKVSVPQEVGAEIEAVRAEMQARQMSKILTEKLEAAIQHGGLTPEAMASGVASEMRAALDVDTLAGLIDACAREQALNGSLTDRLALLVSTAQCLGGLRRLVRTFMTDRVAESNTPTTSAPKPASASAGASNGGFFAKVLDAKGLKLALEVRVAAGSADDEIRLPYWFAKPQSWEVRGAGGMRAQYRGPKQRLASPEAREAKAPGSGFIVVPAGTTRACGECDLTGFDVQALAPPFAYMLGGKKVTILEGTSAALPPAQPAPAKKLRLPYGMTSVAHANALRVELKAGLDMATAVQGAGRIDLPLCEKEFHVFGLFLDVLDTIASFFYCMDAQRLGGTLEALDHSTYNVDGIAAARKVVDALAKGNVCPQAVLDLADCAKLLAGMRTAMHLYDVDGVREISGRLKARAAELGILPCVEDEARYANEFCDRNEDSLELNRALASDCAARDGDYVDVSTCKVEGLLKALANAREAVRSGKATQQHLPDLLERSDMLVAVRRLVMAENWEALAERARTYQVGEFRVPDMCREEMDSIAVAALTLEAIERLRKAVTSSDIGKTSAAVDAIADLRSEDERTLRYMSWGATVVEQMSLLEASCREVLAAPHKAQLRHVSESCLSYKYYSPAARKTSELNRTLIALDKAAVEASESLDPGQLLWVVGTADKTGLGPLVVKELDDCREMLKLSTNERLRIRMDRALMSGNSERVTKVMFDFKQEFFYRFGTLYELRNFPALKERRKFAKRHGVFDKAAYHGMYYYQSQPLHTSLTELEERRERIAAVQCFHLVTKFMDGAVTMPTAPEASSSKQPEQKQHAPPFSPLTRGSYPRRKTSSMTFGSSRRGRQEATKAQAAAVKQLCDLAVRVYGIRDEIYVQIMKQLTRNPSSESRHNGWRLMETCLGSFPPSDALENYVDYFCRRHSRFQCVRALYRRVYLGADRSEIHKSGVYRRLSTSGLLWKDEVRGLMDQSASPDKKKNPYEAKMRAAKARKSPPPRVVTLKDANEVTSDVLLCKARLEPGKKRLGKHTQMLMSRIGRNSNRATELASTVEARKREKDQLLKRHRERREFRRLRAQGALGRRGEASGRLQKRREKRSPSQADSPPKPKPRWGWKRGTDAPPSVLWGGQQQSRRREMPSYEALAGAMTREEYADWVASMGLDGEAEEGEQQQQQQQQQQQMGYDAEGRYGPVSAPRETEEERLLREQWLRLEREEVRRRDAEEFQDDVDGPAFLYAGVSTYDAREQAAAEARREKRQKAAELSGLTARRIIVSTQPKRQHVRQYTQLDTAAFGR